jgi:hypothetical protein
MGNLSMDIILSGQLYDRRAGVCLRIWMTRAETLTVRSAVETKNVSQDVNVRG